jgi:hypothetical protein
MPNFRRPAHHVVSGVRVSGFRVTVRRRAAICTGLFRSQSMINWCPQCDKMLNYGVVYIGIHTYAVQSFGWSDWITNATRSDWITNAARESWPQTATWKKGEKDFMTTQFMIERVVWLKHVSNVQLWYHSWIKLKVRHQDHGWKHLQQTLG